MKLTGWQRMGIVFSALWVLGVGGKAFIDYERVSSGGDPLGGFAFLVDEVNGKRFGNLSKSEVAELLFLEELKSDPERLLSAQPTAISNARARLALDSLIQSLVDNDKAGNRNEARRVANVIAGMREQHHAASIEELKAKLKETGHAAPAEGLLDAEKQRLVASVKLGEIILSITLPLFCLWALYFTVCWVAAGFRRSPP